MSFRIHKGKVVTKALPVTASTEIGANSLVAFSSGRLIQATSASTKESIVGILPKSILSTDSDYAATRDVQVIVPVDKNVEVDATVADGSSLVAGDVGLYQDITDAGSATVSQKVDRSASVIDVVQCVQVISTTRGIFRLNIGGAGA